MGQSLSVNETTPMATGPEQYPVVHNKNTKDRRRGNAGAKGESSSSSRKSLAASLKKKGKIILLVTSKRTTTTTKSTSTSTSTTTPTKGNKQHTGAVSSTSKTPRMSNRKTDRSSQDDSNHATSSFMSPSEDTVDTQPETPSPLSKTDNGAEDSWNESTTTTSSSTTTIQLNDELLPFTNHHQYPTSLPRIGEELEHELYSSSSYSSSSQKSDKDKKKKKSDKHTTKQITSHNETRASSSSDTASATVSSSLAHSHVASVPAESRSHRPPPPTVRNRRSRRKTPPMSSSSSRSASSRAAGGVAVSSQRQHIPAPVKRTVSDQTLASESDDGTDDVGSESDDSSVASYGKRMGVALKNSFKAARKMTKHTDPPTTTAAAAAATTMAKTPPSVAKNSGTVKSYQESSATIMGLTIMPSLFSISEDQFVSSAIIVPPPKSPPRPSSMSTTVVRKTRKPDTKRRNNTLPPRLTSVQSILHHPISQPPRASNKDKNAVVSWVPDTIAGSDSESVSSVGSASSKGSVLSRVTSESSKTMKRGTSSSSGAAIDPMLVSQFNKLKVQAKLSRHNERKMHKMQSRLDRKKQASEYEELWRNFEKLRDSESEYESGLASDDNSTKESLSLRKDKSDHSRKLQERRRQRRAAKEFSLHNSRTWFVNFDSFEETSEDETTSMQLLEPMVEPAKSQHELEKVDKEFLKQNKEFYDKNVKRRRHRRKRMSRQNSALSDDDSSMASNDSSTSFYEEFLKFRRISKKSKSKSKKSDETSPNEVNENTDTENEGDSHNRRLVDIEQSISYDGDEGATDGIRIDLVPSNSIASSVKKSFFQDGLTGEDHVMKVNSFQSPMIGLSDLEGRNHGKALTAPLFLKVEKTNDYNVQRRRRVHSETDSGRSQSRGYVGQGEDLESIFDKEGMSELERLTDDTPSILSLSRDTGLSLSMFSDSSDKSFPQNTETQEVSDIAGLKDHDRIDDACASPAPSSPIFKIPESRRVKGLTDLERLRVAVGSPAKYVTDSQETRRLEGLNELERLRNADGSLVLKSAILRTLSDDEQLIGRTSRLDSIKELARLRSVLPKETSSNLPESPNGATYLGDGKYSI